MTSSSPYIVQYVGFKTQLSAEEFIRIWMPFAANFKRAGIKKIDLYATSSYEVMPFLSRNIWDSKTYFQNFPAGLAGSGGGGPISVEQFGGYWISENELDQPAHMRIFFSHEEFESPISRARCSDRVPFLTQVEWHDGYEGEEKGASPVFDCNHIKSL